MATFDPKTLDFTNPVAPNLPLATQEYERQFQDQFENILRLYFNQLDNAFGSLLGTTGGKYLKFPYGAFSSGVDQTTTANTATLMTLDTTDFSNGVSISSSKITVANAGIYNLQFSVQLENTDNAPQDVFIWLKQNGVDIAGSTGKVGMPARKGVGDPFHSIYGWNYFVSMTVGQYIEIYWSTTNAAVTIQYYPASALPTKPATQSVVATLSFVSRLPT
jgi:hypothetical protein